MVTSAPPPKLQGPLETEPSLRQAAFFDDMRPEELPPRGVGSHHSDPKSRKGTSATPSTIVHQPNNLVVHVGSRVDTILGELPCLWSVMKAGEQIWLDLRKGNLETLLDRLENRLILRAADKRDTKALCSKSTRTTNTMKI